MFNKNLFFGLLSFVFVLSSAFTIPKTGDETVSVNIEKSTVTWKGYKVLGSHEGTIKLKSGNFELNDGVLTGGAFEIDMNTITCTDLEGEWADKLVGHLKSDDFFGSEKYPTAKFEITRVISRGKPGDYKVIGKLRIKETTKEIKFLATVKENEGNNTANARITIDRSDFNVKYGSGSFFSNLGDKTIYDEFDLDIQLVLTK